MLTSTGVIAEIDFGKRLNDSSSSSSSQSGSDTSNENINTTLPLSSLLTLFDSPSQPSPNQQQLSRIKSFIRYSGSYYICYKITLNNIHYHLRYTYVINKQ